MFSKMFSRLKLYFSRKKLTIDEELIVFKIILRPFNTLS